MNSDRPPADRVRQNGGSVVMQRELVAVPGTGPAGTAAVAGGDLVERGQPGMADRAGRRRP
jgi:hypothetical protein